MQNSSKSSAVVASDGYRYKDLTARIFGEKEVCARNDQLDAFRTSGLFTEEGIQAWIKAYDAAANCPIENFYVCNRAGLNALDACREGRARESASVAQVATALRTATEYAVFSGLGAQGHLPKT